MNDNANRMPPAISPRRPLAVTSINAILNNPSPIEANYKPGAITISNSTPHTSQILPNTTQPSISSSNKRKAASPDPAQALLSISDDDPRLENIDQSCDEIRFKINNLLNSGDMKVGEFCKAIGVNSKSYGSFMRLRGPSKGCSNGTYSGAFAFFKKRELAGIKPAKKPRVSKEMENKLMDVSMIKLEGEDEMEVPVYETCDEVRKKITMFLREPGVTQAGFLREIAKSFPDGRNPPQSKVLKDFLSKKGAKAGNTSAVFYGSYVFFEKMRIRDGKEKSKFRLEMEKIYSGGDMDSDDEEPSKRSRRGIDIKRTGSGKFWCLQGERPREDQYGRVTFR